MIHGTGIKVVTGGRRRIMLNGVENQDGVSYVMSVKARVKSENRGPIQAPLFKRSKHKKYRVSCQYVNYLRQSWVSFLNQFNWDWFATLTFSHSPRTYTAQNRVNRWLNALERQEKRKIGYYKAMEFTRLGVPHFHLLMGNLQGVRRDKYWELWFRENGRARILPYDLEKGAAFYISKYVIKDEYSNTENWEIKGLEYLRQLSFSTVLTVTTKSL